MTESPQAAPRPLDVVPSIVLVVAFVVTAVSPRAFGPMATLLMAMLGVAAFAAWAVLTGRMRLDTALLRSLALPAAAIVWLGFSTILAASPGVSWSGVVGQHSGWALWFVLLALVAIAASSARGTDARRIISTVGALGGIAGLVVVWDRLVGLPGATYSRAPSGIFENSLSAGQFLVLGLGCAIGWYVISKRAGVVSRTLALVAIGGNVAGLALADSRGAYAAAVAGIVIWLVLILGPRRGADPRAWTLKVATVLVLVALVGVAVLSAASLGSLGDGVESAWASVANDRDQIWDSAVLIAGQRMLSGRGPDQFSVWSRWDIPRSGELRNQATYDPHNIVLSWLVAGGLPALLLMLAASMALARRVADAVGASRGSAATTAPVAGLAAWCVSLLFAWVNPLTAVAAALVAGSLWGASRSIDDADPVRSLRHVLAWVLVAASVASVAFLIRPAAAELSFAQAVEDDTDVLAAAERGYLRWPDPSYAAAATAHGSRVLIAPAEYEEGVIVMPYAVVAWDSNIALAAALSSQEVGARGEDEAWIQYQRAMDAGRHADPGTSLWDAFTALEASRRGLSDIGERYAGRAIEQGLPTEAADMFEERYPDLE